jgi:hypothetical protein
MCYHDYLSDFKHQDFSKLSAFCKLNNKADVS